MVGKLSNGRIDQILSIHINGRIGFTDGITVNIVPITYLYDGNYIIGHSREGLKIKTMREHPDVCFQVDEIINQTNWESVLVWGKYEELTDQRERYYALDRLIRKISNLKSGKTAKIPHFGKNEGNSVKPEEIKSIVFRINVGTKTGRFENNPESS